tara:strand:+ start:1165 stop:2094 length:930 start_codon:yes stop_codon:yes gene_type:complete
MTTSTTPKNTLIDRFKDLLWRESGWYREFFADQKEKPEGIIEPEDTLSTDRLKLEDEIGPKVNEVTQGYIDTINKIPRDAEPFNMDRVARIEGGPLVWNSPNPLTYENPESGAIGVYQIKPWLHTDIGTLRWHGATPLAGKQDYDSPGKQRGHANRYLTSLLGRYEDRFSGTDTRKYRDKNGNPVFGKDAQGRWDNPDPKLASVYIPRHNVKGARATALASYNLGVTSMDYMLDNNRKLTGKPFQYKYDGKIIKVTEEKLKEVQYYLGKYVAEGELTKQEVLDAFPEMKHRIDEHVSTWHGHNLKRTRR